MGLSLAAWLLFLGGLAYLILAALHNQNGELGLGMDATFSGTKYFMVSFVLGGVGVWQWVAGERRCRMR